MFDLKGPQGDVDPDLELAFEIGGHSPRVPAGAASAILEVVLNEHRSVLSNNLKGQFRATSTVSEDNRLILLTGTASDDRADGDPFASAWFDIGRDDERRAHLDSRGLIGVNLKLLG